MEVIIIGHHLEGTYSMTRLSRSEQVFSREPWTLDVFLQGQLLSNLPERVCLAWQTYAGDAWRSTRGTHGGAFFVFFVFYGHAVAAFFSNLDKWVRLAEQACPGDAGRPSRGMHTRALKIFLPLLTANGCGEGRAHVRALRNILVVLTKNTNLMICQTSLL